MFQRSLKRIGRELETWSVLGLLGFFSLLPLSLASWMGGKMLKNTGRFTSRHKMALKNLAIAFPEKSPIERQHIALKMWEHLGRLFAELPFLAGNRLTSRIKRKELKHDITRQVIYISGHFGQWELLNTLAYNNQRPISSVYRHINNPRLDEKLRQLRSYYCNLLIRKKGESAIGMVRALSGGMSLSLLGDQRLNTGEILPFLGKPAKTNVAAAKLAIKMNLPLVPAFVIRTHGANFIAEVLAPLEIPQTGDETENAKALTLAFNKLLEDRIRANPEQYLWVHDRWK